MLPCSHALIGHVEQQEQQGTDHAVVIGMLCVEWHQVLPVCCVTPTTQARPTAVMMFLTTVLRMSTQFSPGQPSRALPLTAVVKLLASGRQFSYWVLHNTSAAGKCACVCRGTTQVGMHHVCTHRSLQGIPEVAHRYEACSLHGRHNRGIIVKQVYEVHLHPLHTEWHNGCCWA